MRFLADEIGYLCPWKTQQHDFFTLNCEIQIELEKSTNLKRVHLIVVGSLFVYVSL